MKEMFREKDTGIECKRRMQCAGAVHRSVMTSLLCHHRTRPQKTCLHRCDLSQDQEELEYKDSKCLNNLSHVCGGVVVSKWTCQAVLMP